MTELSSTIVTGVADFFDFRQEKSEVVFVVVKHAQRVGGGTARDRH